jgi:hypothetical protein
MVSLKIVASGSNDKSRANARGKLFEQIAAEIVATYPNKKPEMSSDMLKQFGHLFIPPATIHYQDDTPVAPGMALEDEIALVVNDIFIKAAITAQGDGNGNGNGNGHKAGSDNGSGESVGDGEHAD